MLKSTTTWALLSQDQGKLEEAIEAYNKALAIKPDYAEATTTWALLSKTKVSWKRR